MTDVAGGLTYAADYDPYGAPIGIYNIAVTSALGFTGEQTDPSGLQYLRARYYNPATGTFLSQDPIMGVVGGQSVRWNPYVYAGANPVMYVDPSGKIFWLGIIAAAIVGGGIGTGVGWEIGVNQGSPNFNDINWRKVIDGGITGGLLGATGALGVLVGTPAVVGSAIAGSTYSLNLVLSNYANERDLLDNFSLRDFGLNTFFGGLVNTANEIWIKAIEKVVRLPTIGKVITKGIGFYYIGGLATLLCHNG